MHELQREIERLYAMGRTPRRTLDPLQRSAFPRFVDGSTIRAAEKANGVWLTNAW